MITVSVSSLRLVLLRRKTRVSKRAARINLSFCFQNNKCGEASAPQPPHQEPQQEQSTAAAAAASSSSPQADTTSSGVAMAAEQEEPEKKKSKTEANDRVERCERMHISVSVLCLVLWEENPKGRHCKCSYH